MTNQNVISKNREFPIGSLDAVVEAEALMKVALHAYLPRLKDKELPLDGRWAAFSTIAHLMPCEIYGDGFVEELNPNFTLYDNFYTDRYQTRYYTDMYDVVCDKVREGKITQEAADNWRELVLQDGHGKFTNDW